MVDDFDLERLRQATPPKPSRLGRENALGAAMAAYDREMDSAHAQGSAGGRRLMAVLQRSWRTTMTAMTKGRLMTGTAIATILVVPLAGYLAYAVMNDGFQPAFLDGGPADIAAVPEVATEDIGGLGRQQTVAAGRADSEAEERDAVVVLNQAPEPAATSPAARAMSPGLSAKRAPAASDAIAPMPRVEEQNRDRFQSFETNGVKSVADEPVSTFSIDVDTASYSFVRRMLMAGQMPDPASVRVEELINYFPYSYPLPENREEPFGVNVSVAPTPWNEHTKLMHVGIQGFDITPETRPAANLVFLIDVSGSMNEPDKLPLLKAAFRLLLDRLEARDTVSIVTYAGNAGTVLEPTKASERETILEAIEGLESGGSTAGAAGIEEAYRLARKARIEGGINRVLLATDGDFNVGPASDEELKRLIEDRREDGIYLSVFGFGQGNYNDQLMQTLAQNGNGTAAYIDTLAEARKTLVEEAGSTLFPIAGDVKIQVEFNPAAIAEYRLIGYETRALNREDFNNDRVDAGDIGSGHSVTAIYELTPVGSPAVLTGPLRYGDDAEPTASGNADEYAYLKLRYKLPGETKSKLLTTPVGPESESGSIASLGEDERFSIAVAAFGQKLRGTDAVADYSWSAIRELAAGARGDDPFGYRGEFLQLVRIAESL